MHYVGCKAPHLTLLWSLDQCTNNNCEQYLSETFEEVQYPTPLHKDELVFIIKQAIFGLYKDTLVISLLKPYLVFINCLL
jgi:hypothetical protein